MDFPLKKIIININIKTVQKRKESIIHVMLVNLLTWITSKINISGQLL